MSFVTGSIFRLGDSAVGLLGSSVGQVWQAIRLLGLI